MDKANIRMRRDMKPEPVCAYCDKPGTLHRDHVVPRSRGGPDNATNIVMACQSCNSSKGDTLPSEWMGDRCPHRVLLIEARVNAKLKSVFKRRDWKKPDAPAKLYAFYTGDDGNVMSMGEVVSETADAVRIETLDSFMFVAAGCWALSGELVDAPKSQCRMFNDRDACAQVASVILQEHRDGGGFEFD